MNVSGYLNSTLQDADLTTRREDELNLVSMCPEGGFISYKGLGLTYLEVKNKPG